VIKPEHRPWFPVKWELYAKELYALRALHTGEATPEQQKLALDFILLVVCKKDDLSFYPDSPRDGDFAEGKRYVGNQVVKLLKLTSTEIQAALDKLKGTGKPKKLGS
jgi:hypothetical protein